MKHLFLYFLMYFTFFGAHAQETQFEVKLNLDSLLMDNALEVKFTLKNAKGIQFVAPDFEGFQVVSGPSQFSSYSMINGTVSQELSYAYYIQPNDVGNYFIGPASIVVEETVLETAPVEVIVYPNPDGIVQTPKKRQDTFYDFWGRPDTPPAKSQKKRKIYKL